MFIWRLRQLLSVVREVTCIEPTPDLKCVEPYGVAH
jgi:hypothetical protein